MRFRRPDGRHAKLTLGTVDLRGDEVQEEPVIGGHLTLAAARRLAAEVQRQRALGRDPAADFVAEKKRQRSAKVERERNTFGAATRAFIEEYARPKNRRWRDTARMLGLRPVEDGDRLEVIPGGLADRWSEKPVPEVTGHEIFALIDECRRRGIPGLERRREGMADPMALGMFAALHKFFNWLIGCRVVEKNPCTGVARPNPPQARDRVLNDDEIRWFWSACDEIGDPFGPMLKLLLVTGQRRDEVAAMTYSELSDDGKTWAIPKTRTKNGRAHVVPLPQMATGIIAGMRRIAGQPGYVFTTNGQNPISGFSKIKRRLDEAMLVCARREAAKLGHDVTITPWRIHDLRRTAATGMARVGVDLHVTEKVLNHVSGSFGGIVGVYQRYTFADEKRAALTDWANLIREITSGNAAQ